MLKVRNIQAHYGAVCALHEISLDVSPGEIIVLLGMNGAGKSTTLKTISGLLKPRAGEIFYAGKNIAGLPTHQIVARGISHVPLSSRGPLRSAGVIGSTLAGREHVS